MPALRGALSSGGAGQADRDRPACANGAELSPGCRRSLEQGAERGWTEGSVK